MKTALKLLMVPALGLALASCTATYGTAYGGPGYYDGYAAAYPDDYYAPGYGGIVFGGGWHNHWRGHDWDHAGAGHWHAGAAAIHAGAFHGGGFHGGMAGHGGGGGHRG